MYRIEDLKPKIAVTEAAVPCPVAGCDRQLPRQRGRFQSLPDFLCPDHGIYVSPSTFEYADVRRNFPLIDDADWNLFRDRIAVDKRETHRLARERSEDAVSYNAFRSIERAGRLPALVAMLTDTEQAEADPVYWSHSLADGGVLPSLELARQSFGERPSRGSEPDLIAVTPTDLVFIEVKVTSGNKTKPSRQEALKTYETAEGGWYDEVFAADAHTVAVIHEKYELMRFWLLGSWMARREGKRFTLVSLTREIQDMGLQPEVDPLLLQTEDRVFAHWPWESLAHFAAENESTRHVSDYLWSKSVGYAQDGTLQPMLMEIVY